MEREILFRGKRKSDGKWIEGFFVRKKEKCYICTNPYQLMDGYSSEVGQHYGFGDFCEVDPETVCQYTESIAISGKKISEHDIVENDGTIGVVKFGKYGNGFHLGYYIDWINCPHLRNELHYWESKIKVIGNIFDNPELIGDQS